MDVSTGLTVLGSAVGGAKVVEKLLGPTAEYVGTGLKNWTERRVQNVGNIFSAAAKSLGDKIEEPGTVPPKVLKEVLEEGSFNDDPLACEYFGGVLASSRTPISRDDRGASLMKLISNLTTYQIRTHFIFYAALKRTFDGTGRILPNAKARKDCKMYIETDSYNRMMDFGPSENALSLTTHSVFGLHDQGLIGEFRFGSHEQMKKHHPNIKTGGIEFIPTVRGVELFMWACGLGSQNTETFLTSTVSVPDKTGIELMDGFYSIGDANKPSGPIS